MPNDVFEQTLARAREILLKLQGKVDVPSLPHAPRKRKPVVEFCVVRNGTCVTHGNADTQCRSDRA